MQLGKLHFINPIQKIQADYWYKSRPKRTARNADIRANSSAMKI